MNIKASTRLLRKNQTSAEAYLWDKLRNRKFLNLKFTRQYPIIFNYYGKKRYYVADFYCHNLNLVIELDGKIHDFQKTKDNCRDNMMNSLGFVVLRFKNEEVFYDIERVLQKIAMIV